MPVNNNNLTIEETIEQIKADALLLHTFIHGDATQTITLEDNSVVPSIRKFLAEYEAP